MTRENPVKKIQSWGQSIWLDYLHRDMLRSGDLQRLIEEDGICGVTSNPAIFKEAIAGSSAYDEAITALIRAGKSVDQIYLDLVVEDVQTAADQFRPLYEQTEGLNGYVSLEVSPYLARDLDGTLQEARKLWRLLDRPNVMIKVPATVEGCLAIRRLSAEGVNVNATLLFSLERYRAVAEAYVAGLEDRAAAGQPVSGIASVASFFLSRIDTLLDPRLQEIAVAGKESPPAAQDLVGKVAVACAKLSYRIFEGVFHGDRFQRLADLGAMPQRLLWASTGTKNPAYSDIKYVEELIGPDTVNTIPVKTLDAFRDHGRAEATLSRGMAEAEAVLARLAGLGIDLEEGMAHLEEDGIRKFIQPFDSLFQKLDEERIAILEKCRDYQQLDLGCYTRWVQKRVNRMEEEGFGRRFWSKDPTLWKKNTEVHEEIRGFMGWLEVIEAMRERLPEVEAFAAEVRRAGFRHVLVMGMGGSSMTPLVFKHCFPVGAEGIPVSVVDTTDPQTIFRLAAELPLADTLFIEASKSGTTAEPSAFSNYFFDRLQQLKGEKAGANFVAITDPDTPLAERAGKLKFRKTFLNYPDIGGRYSALSCFGLVPAALMGLDAGEILNNALMMKQVCGPDIPEHKNPGLLLGAALGELALQGRNKITFLLPKAMETFGLWLDQLLAESTGKEETGLVPVTGEALGDPGVYGDDRVFIRYRIGCGENDAFAEVAEELKKLDHPLITLGIGGREDIPGEFFRWEVATATAATALGINPFDQPNVQESKKNTLRILQSGALSATASGGLRVAGGGADKVLVERLTAFLARRRPRDYLGLMAYLPDTAAIRTALRELQALLRDATRLPATLGFGPRFLHSTGQLHKGGANNGLFIHMTYRPQQDIPVPGLPYTFGALIQAQAQGDLEALKKYGRRVLCLDLGEDPQKGLADLTGLVRERVTT